MNKKYYEFAAEGSTHYIEVSGDVPEIFPKLFTSRDGVSDLREISQTKYLEGKVERLARGYEVDLRRLGELSEGVSAAGDSVAGD